MWEWFVELSPTVQTLLATLFTWGMTAEEVIPGSQENGNNDLAAIWLMVGFTIMMILDVELG